MDINFSFTLFKNVPTGPASVYNLGFIEGDLDIYMEERLFSVSPMSTLQRWESNLRSKNRPFYIEVTWKDIRIGLR
jgi:hypothetical protein